mmetsp:Transcript_27283/g.78544  ORF Transcript_27283/g.78544 Transcript_27283/m.78544 type:complete len:252 (+) Transcript_27283:139-894(+)
MRLSSQQAMHPQETTPPSLSREPIAAAILANEESTLAAVLDDDPLVVCRPLRRTQEPVVLAAVTCGCSVQLVALLLRRGADAGAVGPERVTPLEAIILAREAQMKRERGPFLADPLQTLGSPRMTRILAALSLGTTQLRPTASSEDRAVQLAWWLLAYGAANGGRRVPLIHLARRAEKVAFPRFAALIENWGGEQAAIVRALAAARRRAMLRRPLSARVAAAPDFGLLDLPEALLSRVLDMLAPWPPISMA